MTWMKFVVGMMPLVKDLQKWSKLTVQELAERFRSPLLRDAVLYLFEPDFSVFYMVLSQMGFMYRNQAAYPLGGSLPLALSLAKRYKQLGGQVQYCARVEKILVENGGAVGVRFMDGSEQRADVVVSGADGYTTIFKLLEGKFTDKEIHERYEHWKPFRSMIYVSAGVKRTFPDYPFSVEGNAFELNRPVTIAGEEHKMIPIRIRNEDPSFAPEGKTVLTSAIFTDHQFWKSLESDRGAYEIEKENVAQAYQRRHRAGMAGYLTRRGNGQCGHSADLRAHDREPERQHHRLEVDPNSGDGQNPQDAAWAGKLLDGRSLGVPRRRGARRRCHRARSHLEAVQEG